MPQGEWGDVARVEWQSIISPDALQEFRLRLPHIRPNTDPEGQFSFGSDHRARAAPGQGGRNSFSAFLADTRSRFQRAKSREFSVTSVAPVRMASDAIRRSRKCLTKSICPNVLRVRRSRMPVSIHAEPGGEVKWPRASWARQSSSRARFSRWLRVPA